MLKPNEPLFIKQKGENMSLFKPIEPPTHAKIGIFGFAGSGKTFTASEIAIGLHKYIKSNKPIYGIETETGLSFRKESFDKAGVKLEILRTRAFVSLIAALNEVAKDDNIILIDSITHFWQEITKAYLKKSGRTRLLLKDFMPLKAEWAPFPDIYLNSKSHIIMCGRAGYTWGESEDEDGEKKTVQTGTKMKVEGDLGYEPTLLIEMEQIKETNKIGSQFVNRSWVIKDKFDVIKGQYFDMPTFNSFLPHIKRLAIGGISQEIDLTTSSVDMISSDKGGYERLKQRDIYIEELQNELSLRFNPRKDDGKTAALQFLRDAFGTTSMTAISNLSNDKILDGLNKLKEIKLTIGKD